MQRQEPGILDQVLIRRQPNELGVRCSESQADGVPCPGPDCRCDECLRANVVVPFRKPRTLARPHA